MNEEKTLIIIKPDGVAKHLTGECLARFERKGLRITDLRMIKLKRSFVKEFYFNLRTKLNPKFFRAIVDFMCSGPVVVAILVGIKAVRKARKICGPTNPKEALPGTIRGDFSSDDLIKNAKRNKPTKNIIHSSSSQKETAREIKILNKILCPVRK